MAIRKVGPGQPSQPHGKGPSYKASRELTTLRDKVVHLDKRTFNPSQTGKIRNPSKEHLGFSEETNDVAFAFFNRPRA